MSELGENARSRLVAAVALAVCATGLGACGDAASRTGSAPGSALRAPAARSGSAPGAGAGAVGAGATPGGGVAVAETPDPEASKAFPESASSPAHALARAPSQARAALASTVAPGAPSDAEVRAELKQLAQIQRAARSGPPRPGEIGADGTVTAAPGTPLAIARVIGGGNAIATFPYVFGGGHASFIDSAYDCSGSVSYALAAAGMLSAPLTSGQLMSWGVPGPGRWLTVYASAGHVYMYVGNLRFDTSFRNGPFGSRWQTGVRTNVGFVARHWPGL